ncbi:hypothetical protein SCHPADRAFT_898161 [Schizopora paradoxa]|uniref:Lethal giant larvae (Lgl)-like C-terminal domain-containing protein n=1 Tax=Schizopora paradoxa TaxID=27342 RepID=A0A0H2SSL4_9AGAM|nr:hypothetical protein SCHPADRAFT_898161 [Schizopora paradoxa]
MFKSNDFADFSVELRDTVDWKPAVIRDLDFLSDASALGVEPVNGLVAIGTKEGKILVFGSRPTGKIVNVPRSTPCKFVQIASLVFRLLCVDEAGDLHVWDLGELGPPKRLTTYSVREPVQCLTISPNHSHAFLALQSGKIVAYDTLCLRKSPYEIPNVWNMVESYVKDSLPMSSPASSPFAIDIVVHPRDLNLLFIAYSGGVVLYDINDRKPVRHYVLLLPPGAPGGTGYSDKSILQPRCPPVSCMSVHASGHLFVIGYEDGCFAFWSTDDGERPLCVRTLDNADAGVPDAEKLDNLISNGDGTKEFSREPIFKLSWSCFGSMSDPWGKSCLTILGGQPGENANSVAVLAIDAFNFAAPTTSQGNHAVHPEIRASLVKALSNTEVQYYGTTGVPHDFLLIPRSTPQGGGAFDPVAMVVLYEIPDGSRTVQAFEFPPPLFSTSPPSAPAAASPSQSGNEMSSAADDLEETLEALRIDEEPANLPLPSSLWVGNLAINDGDIVKLEQDAYDPISHGGNSFQSRSFGRGGIAWVDYSGEHQASEVRWTSQQPHRLLVTHHRDRKIRFQDISPQLLLGSPKEPLKTAFPSPLEHLTIDVPKLLWETCIMSHKRPIRADSEEIQSVQMTSESVECVITMKSGHTIIYRFSERERRTREPSRSADELVSLVHVAAERNCFQPMLLVDNTWGAVTACELSNIGFLAIAYSSGALLVVNMRDYSIMLRHGTETKQPRQSFHLHLHKDDEASRIQSVRWFVCAMDGDPVRRLRLVASRWNGTTHIFTANQVSGKWTIDDAETKKAEGVDQPLPRGLYVFESGTGYGCLATTYNMRRGLGSAAPSTEASKEGAHCFWLSVGRKGCRCVVNFAGSRVAKVDWGRGRNVECVEVVSRKGGTALVAIMDTKEVQIYSIPALVPMHKFQLLKQPLSVICLDDTGDYVDWVFDDTRGMTVSRITMGTLFAMRRVFDEPVVDFASNRKQAGAVPPPIPLGPASLLGSFFNFKKSVSGDQVDALLAGPKRPLEGDAQTTTAAVNGQWQAQMQTRASAIAAQASQAGNEIYSNLAAALNERGESLGNLNDNLQSISDGASRMASSAKRIAAEQSAKAWFRFGRGTGE